MRNLFARLWKDDAGVVAVEYMLTGSLLALGLIAGLSILELSINDELIELGLAYENINQGFVVEWQSTCKTVRDGSNFVDLPGTASPILLSNVNAPLIPATVGDINSCP